MSMHREEDEVKKWAALDPKTDKIERRTIMQELKALGNHQHNMDVLAKKEGLLHVSRAPCQDVHYSQYVPCHLCLVWFAKTQLYRHKCHKAVDGKTVSMKKSKGILLSLNSEITQGMAAVLNGLTKDRVGLAAEGDSLIREQLRIETAGGSWRQKKCKDQLRSKIRYASRLLCQLQDDCGNEDLTFTEALVQDKFSCIVESAKKCAMDDQHEMGLSETTIKIGQMVSSLAQRKLIIAIQNKDTKTQQDMIDFQTIFNTDWPKLIGKPSRREILFRRRNQKILLPTTSDVKKFSEGLKDRLSDAISQFEVDTSNQTNYRSLQDLTLVRTIQFNRRRGQVSLMRLYRHF